MTARAVRLSERVIEWLGPTFPQGITISTLPSGAIQLTDDHCSREDLHPEALLRDVQALEETRAAVYLVLSGIQDFVAESIREPWPRGLGKEMPLPVVAEGRDGAWEIKFESP